MDEDYRKLLLKQQYRIYKDHAAVKLCHWMKESMTHGRTCYKQDFYGIESHRCLQMTPAINECSHRCQFCWRVQNNDFEIKDWAEPKDLLDNIIKMQRELITGFNGNSKVSKKIYAEAKEPNQIAISLAGEPIIYPYLSDFIKECHSRNMVTFLVTNGTYPEQIIELDELPRQLYVTIAAPNEEIYKKTCRPKVDDGWKKIMSTLESLSSLGTRTVIRHTLVKNMNLGWVDEYAKLDNIGNSDLIEVKGYVFVGSSRERLLITSMPFFEEIKNFALQLGDLTEKQVIKEKDDSKVVLLGQPEMETDVRKLYNLC